MVEEQFGRNLEERVNNMKKLIITGSNGQLGKELQKMLKDSTEYELINTDVAELDITNLTDVLAFVEDVMPYAIINCAAHTGVDACETQIDLAYKINAIGPRNLAIAATKVQAKIVHVSTDYVFSGDGSRPYTEFDEVGPVGIYGKSKRAGEDFVKEFSSQYFIIRTAWLYGDGNNFVKTMLRLSATNPEVRVVCDQFGTPTSAYELAKAICYLVPSDNYGVFHGTCEGSCNWAEFAQEIFRLAGKDTKVIPIPSSEYVTPAKRPAYSIMENHMLKLTTDFEFADWKEAISRYMESLEY